jgi:hypothetical protein
MSGQAVPGTVFMAMPGMENVRPAFTVTKLAGTKTRKVHIFDKENNKILSKNVEEDAGYLVKFAKGHSIRCRDLDHVKEIGAGLQMVPLVDTETGDVKGAVNNIDDILEEAAA